MIYTPLYIKTDYSLLSSLIKINDLIEFAKKNNIKSLSIVDDNLSGVMEFYKECIKNNIKPIIGLEVTIENKKIILLAKNYEGYLNLIKIEQIKEINELNKYNSNLICILPFESKSLKEKLSFNHMYISYKNKQEFDKINDQKIYMNEILCFDKEDLKYLNYLEAIKTGELNNESKDNYFVLEKNIEFDLRNNYKITEMCNVELKFHQDLIPEYTNNSYEYLKKLCIEGLKKIFGDKANVMYAKRLKYELEIINKMHFCDYFLIVWDYVKFAKENGILVGPGRGSAAGSLVSYCLNIIEIDPLKYDLLFERFLNEERITMPDIDIDFDGLRIEEVINYCKKKYGEKNVLQVMTYNTMTTKQVLKDVGKALNIDEKEVEYFSKMFKSKDSLKTNYENSIQIKNHLAKNEELKELYDIALKLENLKKYVSIHASGVVISKEPLDNVIPIKVYRDDYLTGYPAEYLEEIGLIKMDFLSLKTLTTLDILLKEANINFNEIKLNDQKTMELFKNGNTLGVFQFESQGMMHFLKELKPNSFVDIYNAIALYRPGPFDNIESFIKRRIGKEKIDYFDSSLENVLKSTYGIMIYQEQIMMVANIMASYTLAEADLLRRAMSKKKDNILKDEKDKFIKRAIENGYKEDLATKIYDLIFKFSKYGFNKAHAVAYSILSYKMAYIKANYPLIFMKNLLDNSLGSIYDLKEKIKNTKENNIKILNPDINISEDYFKIKDDNLIYPFVGIKDINKQIALEIMNKRPFNDIFDFVKKVDLNLITKDIFKNLILAGSFDSLNINRNTLISNLDVIYNYAELSRDIDDIKLPEIDIKEEYTVNEITKEEYNVFGLYLNNNPIIIYRNKLDYKISTNSINNYQNKKIYIILRVENIKEITNKNNEKMCFLTLSDEYGTIDGTIFSNTYELVSIPSVGDIVKIYGKFNIRNGKEQIIINHIEKIDE